MKLNDIEVQRELGTLEGWARRGAAIVKTFTFPTFVAAIAFVDRAAVAAERMDHHPDLDIRYNKVTVTLSTHSAGGITGNDFALARALEKANGEQAVGRPQ